MEDKEFERTIVEAVGELPKDIKDKLENVAIVTADWPTREQMKVLWDRGERGMLLGLYQGIPQTKRRNYGVGGNLPDKITIFKDPLLRISRSHQEAIANIKKTVLHELGHHFGMSEEAIRKAQSKI